MMNSIETFGRNTPKDQKFVFDVSQFYQMTYNTKSLRLFKSNIKSLRFFKNKVYLAPKCIGLRN